MKRKLIVGLVGTLALVAVSAFALTLNDKERGKFVSTDEGPAVRGTLAMSISTNPLPLHLNDREFQKFVMDADSNVAMRVYLGDSVVTGAVGSGGIIVTQNMGVLYISGGGGGGDPTNWSWFVAVSNVLPNASNTLDLGSADFPFRDLYLGTSSIYMGSVKVLSFNPATTSLVLDVQTQNASGSNNLVAGDNVSVLNNDAGYLIMGGTGASTNISDYNNDSGFITGYSETSKLVNVLSRGRGAGGLVITNAGTPVAAGDLATKGYVDLQISTTNFWGSANELVPVDDVRVYTASVLTVAIDRTGYYWLECDVSIHGAYWTTPPFSWTNSFYRDGNQTWYQDDDSIAIATWFPLAARDRRLHLTSGTEITWTDVWWFNQPLGDKTGAVNSAISLQWMGE